MPTYDSVHKTEEIRDTPDWVYFDERADRDTITLKLSEVTLTGGKVKSGTPLVKGADGFYKAATKGTKEKPAVCDGLLLFDVCPAAGAESAVAALFTRGTVTDKLNVAEGIALPSTIRVK